MSWCCSYVSPQNDNRPILPITVHGQSVYTLFDSGANVTACSSQFFKKLKIRPKLERSMLSLNTASGEKLRVCGIAELRYQFGSQAFLHPTYVIDGLQQKSIIGSDAMSRQRLMIDVNRKTITKAGVPDNVATIKKKTEIPPFSEVMVTGKTNARPGQQVLISPGHDRIHVVEAAATVTEENQLPVVLRNATNQPILLQRNEVLGKIESLRSRSHDVSATQVASVSANRPAIITEQDVNLTGIPANWKQRYLQLLRDFSDIFSINPYDIGKCDVIKQRLTLKDKNKIASKPPYRIPHHLKGIAEKYIDDLLKADVIQKSSSPFSAPIMVIPKAQQDEKKAMCENYRIVADYRNLNANLVNDCYPLHNIYDLIDEVANGQVWSVIDLSSGFWNQVLDEDSRKYTAFGLPGKGHFEFTRAAQGIKTSPASFQRLLDYVIRGIKGCFCYVDDIVVSSQNHEDHLATLREVFRRFRKYNLKCRLRKVQLGTPEINYLGYNLTRKHGIRAGEIKINAVKQWKPPTDVKQVKQFLGLASFFRRTIRDFAVIASPLTKLTRNDSPWKEGRMPSDAMDAFLALKRALCERPCLKPVNFDQEIILTVDASTTVGLGAMISQKDDKGQEHPCAYASRSLKEEEQKYAPFVLEAVGMLWAFRHFRPYLVGRHFTVRTDHRPLLSLNKTQSAMMDRIRLELMDYQPFTVEHISGEKMPVDGLSRNIAPSLNEVSVAKIPKTFDWEQIYHLQKEDGHIKALVCFLKWKQLPFKDEFRQFVSKLKGITKIERGVVCVERQGRSLVLAPQVIKGHILRAHHDSPLAGHFGPQKTLAAITDCWYWPNMEEEIREYCQSCHVCATVNVPHSLKKQPLQDLPLPSHFNDRVSADLCGPFKPTLQGNVYVLVLVDMFTKYSRFVPLPNKKGETVAKAIFEQWCCIFSGMNVLQTDLGTDFTNHISSHLYQKLGITHQTTSPGHAQSNGQSERFVRKLLTYLRKYLDNSNEWDSLLPTAQLSFNTSIHAATNQTPHFAVFKDRPHLPTDIAVPTPSRQTYYDSPTKNNISMWQSLNYDLRKSLQESFTSAKQAFDKSAVARKFPIGAIVYVTRPKSGTQTQKLQPLYMGPYVVLARSNKNNYRLQVKNGRKEIVVHANRIKILPFRQQLYSYPAGQNRVDTKHSTVSSGPHDSNVQDFTPFLDNHLAEPAPASPSLSTSTSPPDTVPTTPALTSPGHSSSSTSDETIQVLPPEPVSDTPEEEEGRPSTEPDIGHEEGGHSEQSGQRGSWHLSESDEEVPGPSGSRQAAGSDPVLSPSKTRSYEETPFEKTASSPSLPAAVAGPIDRPTGARPKTTPQQRIVKELPFPPVTTRSKQTTPLPKAHEVPLPLSRKPPVKKPSGTPEPSTSDSAIAKPRASKVTSTVVKAASARLATEKGKVLAKTRTTEQSKVTVAEREKEKEKVSESSRRQLAKTKHVSAPPK
jgi:hypothetical protein